ncbi:carbonyl reductase [NADPH] 1-like [Argopecten irradians]|uniref:carbonyl reductase [NADPH] 1-like n=1 Tax=Argopecten irradians TaxID=31199 RepID=UPI003718DC5C
MSGNTNTLVAVVTGANKGVGFGVVRGLCKQFKGDVYLTARNEKLGLKAVEDLKKEGLSPKFHILDITKPETITALKTFLQTTYGGLDVLVNNAGMAYKVSSDAPFGEQAEVTVGTNFTGTLNVCEVLFPILRPHARYLSLNVHIVFYWVWSFTEVAIHGCHIFTSNAKFFINMVELIQLFIGKRLSSVPVNCDRYYQVSPSKLLSLEVGFTTKTIDQGADTPVYLAMLPRNTLSPKGDYVSDRKIGKWE